MHVDAEVGCTATSTWSARWAAVPGSGFSDGGGGGSGPTLTLVESRTRPAP